MISTFARRALFIVLLLWTSPAPNAEFASERQWWNKMIGATQTNQLKLGNGNGDIAGGVLDASICTKPPGRA